MVMERIAVALVLLTLACHVTAQNFNIMTTTSSVAITWDSSGDFNVTLIGPRNNVTRCHVTSDDVERICTVVEQEPSTRYEVKVISANGWTELLRTTTYTKPYPARSLTWTGASREVIHVQWTGPEKGKVEGYLLMMVRLDNNMTAYQEVARTRLPLVERRIYLPYTYSTPYGTNFLLTVWSMYQDEKSSPVSINVYSAPRYVPRIWEDDTRRTNTSTTVVWFPPEAGDVTHYQLLIKIRGNSQFRYNQLSSLSTQNVTIPGTALEYTFMGLTPASLYDVDILAMFHGAQSSQDRSTTAYTNPSPVRAVAVAFVTEDMARMEWRLYDPFLPGGVEYTAEAVSLEHQRKERIGSSALSTQVRYLRAGGRYNISLRIRMMSYPNPTSEPVFTIAQIKPKKVTNIKFTEITSHGVNVSWRYSYGVYDSASIRFYGTYVKKEWTTPVIAKDGRSYIVLTGMHPGETYHVGVSAVSGGVLSDEETKSLVIPPEPPSRIEIIESSITETSAEVEIHFNVNKSANTEFRVEYGLWSTNRFKYTIVEKPPPHFEATSVKASLTRLDPGLLHSVRVFGKTTGNLQSPIPTDVITFRTLPRFRSSLMTRLGVRSMLVSFQASYEDFEGYVISVSPGDHRKLVMKYERPEVSFFNLVPGTLYNVSGQVYSENQISVPFMIKALTNPEVFVECGAANQTSVELKITDPSGGLIDDYQVDCNPGCSPDGTIIKDINVGGVTSHVITGMNPGTSYQFRARARRFEERLKTQSRVMIIYCKTEKRIDP